MKRIVNSPLKTLGFLTIILAIIIIFFTGGYLLFLGLYMIGIGLILYLLNFIVLKNVKTKYGFWLTQLLFSLFYVLFVAWAILKQGEHNSVIFPNHFKGQAGIIFGIKGYPPLEETNFWKKNIVIPENGILITSTKEEEIPSIVRYYFKDGTNGNFDKISWDPNFQYSCIVNSQIIKAWLFTFDKLFTNQVQRAIVDLSNDINVGKRESLYSTSDSHISKDAQGENLNLQGQNIYYLPDAVSKLNLHQINLTGNNFTAIPNQVYSISNLEILLIGHNPIDSLTTEVYKLNKLKDLYLNTTNIKTINIDLSKLDSLNHLDLSENELDKLPDQVKNIPNLKWLSLENNKFTNLSFIDSRLSNIETLYIQSNKITIISSGTDHLRNLKELLIFDNNIDSIPDQIAYLTKLEKLEIWDNPIRYISPKIKLLTSLREMRIDDDNLTNTDKDNLKKWLPNCIVSFQTRADKLK